MKKMFFYFCMLFLIAANAYAEALNSPLHTIYDPINNRYLVTQNDNKLVAVDNNVANASTLLTLNSPASMVVRDSVLYVADKNKVVGYHLSNMAVVYQYNFTAPVELKGICSDNSTALYLVDAVSNNIYKLNTVGSVLTNLNIQFNNAIPNGCDFVDGSLYITAVNENAEPYQQRIIKYDIANNAANIIYNSNEIQGINSITHDKNNDLYACFYGAGDNNGTVIKYTKANANFETIASNLAIPSSIAYRQNIESLILSLTPINDIGFILIGPAPKVEKTYPANNAQLDDYKIIFKWAAIKGVAGYDLMIARDEAFTKNIVTSKNETNSSKLTILDTGKIYYWKVRAYNLGVVGDWSDVWAFQTGDLNYKAPRLIKPSNKATEEPLRPTFVWSRSNAGIYELQISRTVNFEVIFGNIKDLTDTSYTLQNELTANSSFYWRVRTYSGINSSDWSMPYLFSTYNTAPAMPELYYPQDFNPNISRKVMLEWKPVPNTDLYKVELSLNNLFDVDKTEYFDVLPSDEDKEFVAIKDSLLPFTWYFWKVKGINAYGEGAWSEIWTFQTVHNGDTLNPGAVWESATKLASYPMPAIDNINADFSFANANASVSVELYNTNGELLKNPEFNLINDNKTIRINTSYLKNGHYIAKIINDSKIYFIQFVK